MYRAWRMKQIQGLVSNTYIEPWWEIVPLFVSELGGLILYHHFWMSYRIWFVSVEQNESEVKNVSLFVEWNTGRDSYHEIEIELEEGTCIKGKWMNYS